MIPQIAEVQQHAQQPPILNTRAREMAQSRRSDAACRNLECGGLAGVSMMACVMVPARIAAVADAAPISRLRGVALVERLHLMASEGRHGELESVLRALPAAQWTGMEAASRSWRLAGGGSIDPHSGEGAAALASMVRDGFARQRALSQLVERDAPEPRVTTRAVALRALDHVEAIRAEAATYLQSMTAVEHLEAALGVLLASGQRRAAPEAIRYVEQAILAEAQAHLPALRESDDRAVRRWAWQATTRAGLATAPDLERAAESDPDIGLRRWAAQHLITEHPAVDALRLLGSRSVELRVAALSQLTDQDLSVGRLRALLLDPAARVREIARYRAPRYGIDLADTYREVLDDPAAPTRAVTSALEGLSLHGDTSDLPALTMLTSHPRPRVRAAAAQAVASRADTSSTTRLLLPVLADPSPRVAATAARMIARFGRPPGIRIDVAEGQPIHDTLEVYWSSTQAWTRRAAWIAARSRGGWLELLACLRLAQDEDAALSSEGITATRGWATRTSVAGRPAPAVANLLDENLRRVHDRGLLDRRTADLIAFTGSLTRYPTTSRQPAVPSEHPARPTPRWVRLLARLRLLRPE